MVPVLLKPYRSFSDGSILEEGRVESLSFGQPLRALTLVDLDEWTLGDSLLREEKRRQEAARFGNGKSCQAHCQFAIAGGKI